MKITLSPSIRTNVWALPGSTNWGKNAKKKMVSLGFDTLIRTAVRTTRQLESGPASSATANGVRSHQVCHAKKSR